MRELLVFLPVLGAPLLHAPLLRLDAFPALRRPLDGGRTVRGSRLFGDNKTWRGAIAMVCGTQLAAVGLSFWEPYWDALPAAARAAGPLVLGTLLGLGAVAGELPNSFLKRQLGIPAGAHGTSRARWALIALDQGDLVLGIGLCLLPLLRVPLGVLAVAFVVVGVIHLCVGAVGYRIGARATSW